MPKLGRNDPCWCGSGKKFKKCHGGNLNGGTGLRPVDRGGASAKPETAPPAYRTVAETPVRIDADMAGKVKAAVLETLRTERTPVQALVLGRSAIIWAEQLITLFESENPLPQPLACQAGCHFCCFFPVQVTPPEVLLLGRFILENFSAQEQSDLLERAEHYLRLSDAIPPGPGAPIRTDLPCPLLKEEKCSVYPMRPLACRAMHSLEAKECERALTSPSASFGRYYAHRQEFILSIVQGLREGCRAAACQGDTLNLAAALTDFFRQPEPEERWLRGEKVFRS